MADEDDGIRRGSVPVPDPTLLTTQQLFHELAALRDFVDARYANADRIVDLLHRLAAEARENTATQVAGLRTFLDGEIKRIEEVRNEKFSGIENRFRERDERFELRSNDAKEATALALQCSGEAAVKSEANFTKALDNQQKIIDAIKQNADDKIADITRRLDRGEGSSNTIYGMAAAMVSVLALLIAAYAAYHANQSSNTIQPTVQYVPAPTAVPAPITVPAPLAR